MERLIALHGARNLLRRASKKFPRQSKNAVAFLRRARGDIWRPSASRVTRTAGKLARAFRNLNFQ